MDSGKNKSKQMLGFIRIRSTDGLTTSKRWKGWPGPSLKK